MNRRRNVPRAAAEWVVVMTFGCLGLLAAFKVAARDEQNHKQFQTSTQGVRVTPPSRRPVPSQADVDLAVALYSLDMPRHLDPPVFDPELEDRGLTTGSTLHGARSVFIGPAAFSSWGILGSTLGHEIEVHGRQNFLAIALQDDFFRLLGNLSKSGFALASMVGSKDAPHWGQCTGCGTLRAEREAYGYEIANARRFGLTDDEVRLIWQVMETYYPQGTEVPAQPHAPTATR